jgi:predicted metalloprotease with PDZ domain
VLHVTHRVYLADPHAHLLGVETTIGSDGGPLPDPLVLFMPVWTPGSYLVREYARHVESFTARSSDGPLGVEKIRKNAWAVRHAGAARILVAYRVYANEMTVRTNHVDASHAYWNGAATYLAVDGAAELGAELRIDMPEGWSIATALAPLADRPGTFVASSFDELCDAPVECGKLLERTFTTLGKSHRMVAWDNPDARSVDWDKVTADTQTIIEAEARLIAGNRDPKEALPYDKYLFLWHVSPRGRGGLEHRSSATLLVKPQSFGTRNGYLDVLSLIAHEFFHLWNVKRIRPGGLSPYRYESENYTRALWWFEGATAYYDWRVLALSKLATPAEYLNHLAEEIARLDDTPGASVHSLAESSFDAWIKAYRPDENSLNSTVSYYLKGEIVCALLDLEIRRRSGGKASLDDVVRHLFWNYGAQDRPVDEKAWPGVFASVAGTSLEDCLNRWVSGTDPLPVSEMLRTAGLEIERTSRRDAPKVALGLKVKLEGGRAIVDAIYRGRAAQKAGIDVRDELVAIADRRVEDAKLDACLAGREPGQVVPVLIARDGWVRTVQVALEAARPTETKISARADASAEEQRLYEAWLGEPFSSAPQKPKTA